MTLLHPFLGDLIIPDTLSLIVEMESCHGYSVESLCCAAHQPGLHRQLCQRLNGLGQRKFVGDAWLSAVE